MVFLKRAKKARRLLWILPAAVLCAVAAFTPAGAQSGELPALQSRKVVRVGYPIQANLTDKTDAGHFTGYNVDYLNEIVKYTNWDIEYVEVDGDINTQIGTLGDMLESGEIDMMGTMVLNEYTEDMYLFPTYSYGNTYTALCVGNDAHFWATDEFKDWDGIRVATYPGLERRMVLLEQFAKISGFSYTTVEYDSLDAVMDAARSGEADACLQVDIAVAEGLRPIARFSPSPYYFAINRGREDLVKELNSAMYSLMEFHPGLQSELYSRYFLSNGSFHISDEEREWIAAQEPLRVLYFTGNVPIQYEKDGEPAGVAAKFIAELSAATGLKTVPVFASSGDEGRRLVSSGEVDLVAAMTCDNDVYSQYNIRLSNPYFESSAVRMLRDDGEPTSARPILSVNTELSMNNLKHRNIPVAVVDSYCAEHYMKKLRIYDSLYAEWASSDAVLYSVGILPAVDERVAGIISGFAGSISQSQRQSMLYEASDEPIHYTLSEYMEAHIWRLVFTVVLIVMTYLIVSRIRREKAVKENEREAEQLYQYSKIVNECLIRYDMRQDRLMMQNNKIMFENREVLCPFLKEEAEPLAQDENERRCIAKLQEMLKNRTDSCEFELLEDGLLRWYRINLAYVNNEYAVGRMYNIEAEVTERDALQRKATYDALTGIMNRAAIQQFLDEYLKNNQDGVFLLMDLDNFKSVNDTMGHMEGDNVLKKFAKFLENNFGSEDLKVRLGGDEFVVFLPVSIPKEQLKSKLSKFMSDVAEQVFADYAACRLSVSIGAAYITGAAESLDDLYNEADKAMYFAKQNGKNSFYIKGSGILA